MNNLTTSLPELASVYGEMEAREQKVADLTTSTLEQRRTFVDFILDRALPNVVSFYQGVNYLKHNSVREYGLNDDPQKSWFPVENSEGLQNELYARTNDSWVMAFSVHKPHGGYLIIHTDTTRVYYGNGDLNVGGEALLSTLNPSLLEMCVISNWKAGHEVSRDELIEVPNIDDLGEKDAQKVISYSMFNLFYQGLKRFTHLAIEGNKTRLKRTTQTQDGISGEIEKLDQVQKGFEGLLDLF